MPAHHYEVGVLRHRDTPRAQMLRRTWTREKILQSLAWLKRENALGAEIFIRPKNTCWILLDDLSREKMDRLKPVGVPPSVVVETSPDNYQAWIKISNWNLSETEATMVARGLAQHFGADPNSAECRHLGRLAGFTNRKAKYQKDGLFPYALLHKHREITAPRGAQILEWARKQIQATRPDPAPEPKLTYYNYEQVKRDFLANLQKQRANRTLPRKQDRSIDWSRVDFRQARDMAKAGHTRENITRHLLKHSPDLSKRKGHHALDYVTRTAHKAIASIRSRTKEEDREKEEERERGNQDWGLMR